MTYDSYLCIGFSYGGYVRISLHMALWSVLVRKQLSTLTKKGRSNAWFGLWDILTSNFVFFCWENSWSAAVDLVVHDFFTWKMWLERVAICNEIEVGIGLHLLRRFGEASIAAKYHFLCRVDECLRERRRMIGAVTSAGGSSYGLLWRHGTLVWWICYYTCVDKRNDHTWMYLVLILEFFRCSCCLLLFPGGEWQWALGLLSNLTDATLQANDVAYNAAISAWCLTTDVERVVGGCWWGLSISRVSKFC